MGSKGDLLRTLAAASGVKSATPGVRSSVLIWPERVASMASRIALIRRARWASRSARCDPPRRAAFSLASLGAPLNRPAWLSSRRGRSRPPPFRESRRGVEPPASAAWAGIANEAGDGLDPGPAASHAPHRQPADHGLKRELASLHAGQAGQPDACAMDAVVGEGDAWIGRRVHSETLPGPSRPSRGRRQQGGSWLAASRLADRPAPTSRCLEFVNLVEASLDRGNAFFGRRLDVRAFLRCRHRS